VWKAWCHIRQGLELQKPVESEATERQNIFWNGQLNDHHNMIGNSPYSFGNIWAQKKISKIQK